MELFLSVLGIVAGSTGLSTVIVALLNRRWTRKDREDSRLDALVAAQKVTMIDRVRYLGSKYVEQGSITLEDKENLHEMYNAYKALGGNGHLATVMAEVNRLAVRGRGGEDNER